MPPTYAVSLATFNRGATNYLAETLASLARGGVFASKLSCEVHVTDGGSADLAHLQACTPYPIADLHYGWQGQTANRTSIEAIRSGVISGAEWVLFLEDDVAVCGRFIESIDAWLAEHASPERHFYTLYLAYREVAEAYRQGGTALDFPIAAFYGSQACLFRRADAEALIAWFEASPLATGPYQHFDFALKDWHTALWPDLPLRATVPCFVQHMGAVSALGNDVRYHQTPAWLGEGWSYA